MVWKGCERSVITYSSLISACEKAGHWELAMELFNEMHQEGCTPNTVTYNSLITACAQGTMLPYPLSTRPTYHPPTHRILTNTNECVSGICTTGRLAMLVERAPSQGLTWSLGVKDLTAQVAQVAQATAAVVNSSSGKKRKGGPSGCTFSFLA